MTFVAGYRGRRFPSKKALKDHVRDGGEVDLINHNFSGPDTSNYISTDAPVGKRFNIVGPTEYQRKWYATLTRRADGKVVVA